MSKERDGPKERAHTHTLPRKRQKILFSSLSLSLSPPLSVFLSLLFLSISSSFSHSLILPSVLSVSSLILYDRDTEHKSPCWQRKNSVFLLRGREGGRETKREWEGERETEIDCWTPVEVIYEVGICAGTYVDTPRLSFALTSMRAHAHSHTHTHTHTNAHRSHSLAECVEQSCRLLVGCTVDRYTLCTHTLHRL